MKFKKYTRYAKFDRAKQVVENWLAQKLGTPQNPNHELAASVMKRACPNGGAMKQRHLQSVLDVADWQASLERDLKTWDKNRIFEINTKSVNDVVNELQNKRPGGVGAMLKTYHKIRGQGIGLDIGHDVREFNQMIACLNGEQHDLDNGALFALNWIGDLLSPDTRRELERVSKGRALDANQRKQLNALLQRDRDALVGRKLNEFRNDPQVMKALVERGYQTAIGKITTENVKKELPDDNDDPEITLMNSKKQQVGWLQGDKNRMIQTLTDDNSKVNQAFQLYTQKIGKSATENQRVAELVLQLNKHYESLSPLGDNVTR
ncbi:MAG: hypothetical protein MI861_15815, partial [Pirellulales bacterium]|nr:hypothetical protein [Pirellulales bacterium]